MRTREEWGEKGEELYSTTVFASKIKIKKKKKERKEIIISCEYREEEKRNKKKYVY